MKRQDFRIAWRLMVKEPGYSLVAVLGLAVGLAAFLLLSGFARYSWSYNAQVPDADHVYLIKHRFNVEAGRPWWDKAPMVLREAALATPGVTDATGYLGWFPLNIQVDGQLHKLRSLTVLPRLRRDDGIAGSPGRPGRSVDAAGRFRADRIRREAAVWYHGRARALVPVEHRGDQRRCAHRRDPARPAIEHDDSVRESQWAESESLVPPMFRDEALHGQMGWPGHLLIRLHPDASVATVTDALQKFD